MNPWALLLASSLLTCAGQLLQKRASTELAGDRLSIARVARNGALQLAVVALALGALCWLLVLQRIEVGVAYPMLALNFVWVTLGARLWFDERPDARHWVGVACIVVGVVLLGASA